MTTLGFEEYRNMLSFRRSVIEKNDLGMEEFVENLGGEEDYNYCLSLVQR